MSKGAHLPDNSGKLAGFKSKNNKTLAMFKKKINCKYLAINCKFQLLLEPYFSLVQNLQEETNLKSFS